MKGNNYSLTLSINNSNILERRDGTNELFEVVVRTKIDIAKM